MHNQEGIIVYLYEYELDPWVYGFSALSTARGRLYAQRVHLNLY